MRISNFTLQISEGLRFFVVWLVCIAINSAQPATIVVRGPVRSPVQGGGGGGSNVTFDTSAKSSAGANFASLTISITIASNSNRLLVVGGGAGDGTAGDRTIDSASSNVDGALTAVTSGAADDGNFVRMGTFYLKNPTVGAHTITVTYAGAGACEQGVAFAVSLYGVDQTTPIGTATVVNGSAASTGPTGAVTLGADDMAVAFIATDSGPQVDIATGTQRQSEINVSGDTAYACATNTGTGSIAVTWTTNSEPYAVVVLPINGAP